MLLRKENQPTLVSRPHRACCLLGTQSLNPGMLRLLSALWTAGQSPGQFVRGLPVSLRDGAHLMLSLRPYRLWSCTLLTSQPALCPPSVPSFNLRAYLAYR